jgi:hypothetical protein
MGKHAGSRGGKRTFGYRGLHSDFSVLTESEDTGRRHIRSALWASIPVAAVGVGIVAGAMILFSLPNQTDSKPNRCQERLCALAAPATPDGATRKPALRGAQPAPTVTVRPPDSPHPVKAIRPRSEPLTRQTGVRPSVVPGPVRTVWAPVPGPTVTRRVPGPTVTVTKTVPGPTQTIYVKKPRATKTVYMLLPGVGRILNQLIPTPSANPAPAPSN